MTPIILKKYLRFVLGQFYLNHSNLDTIFIAGSGRSGTTWLTNIINHDNSYRLLFEPFDSRKNKLIKHFNYRQYIRENCNDTHYSLPIYKILSGNIRNLWIDRYNSSVISKKRIIKDIRANFFLKWIKSHHPNIPIVFIIRHPCAVAMSKINLNWEIHIDDMFNQKDLVEDFLYPFCELKTQLRSNFQKHIMQWCIENYIPLKQFDGEEIHIMFYENLYKNPENEIKKLFNYLDLNLDNFNYKAYLTPSYLAKKHSFKNKRIQKYNSWYDKIDSKDYTEAHELLKSFKMNHLYDEYGNPIRARSY